MTRRAYLLVKVSSERVIRLMTAASLKLDAGGKPSTWFPPEGHVEHI